MHIFEVSRSPIAAFVHFLQVVHPWRLQIRVLARVRCSDNNIQKQDQPIMNTRHQTTLLFPAHTVGLEAAMVIDYALTPVELGRSRY